MSRRSSKQNAISLFPFLAVLVCTMGALILLLLVTTRRMHKEQQQAAEVAEHVWESFDEELAPMSPGADAFLLSLDETRTASQAAPPTEFSIALLPPTPVKEAKAEVESADPFHAAMVVADKQREVEQLQQQLTIEREKQRDLADRIAAVKQKLQFGSSEDADYQTQMQQLADLKHQESELAERLQQKQLALAQLQSELEESSETTATAESILRSQESALVSLRQIAEDSAAQSAVGTDQTVVEFTNSTGTRRTPIIVDVTAAGFEILPCGIRVTHENMKETPDRYNPLVAGVLAINKYRNPHASSVQPYVLLLVRPDGGSVFYSAKSVFQEIGLHWGYELLEQDHKIAAGRYDAEETEVARAAVLDALSRRFPDFQKYAALKEQVAKELEAKKQASTDSRSVTMLPDGTMILPGEEVADRIGIPGMNKRFYAGGHAPKTTHGPYQRADETPEERVATQQETVEENRDVGNPFAMLAETEASDVSETRSAASSPPASFFDSLSETAGSDETSAPEMFPGRFGNEAAETLADMPAGFLDTADMNLSDVAADDHRQLLRKQQNLSDNLGIGGRQASQQMANQSATTSADFESNNANNATELNRTDPREPTDWSDSMTAKHGPEQQPIGQAGDSSFSESSANGSAASDELISASPVNATANGGGGGGGTDSHGSDGPGSSPGSDEESFLRKFLQKVEEERAEHRPDPMLVSMLNNAKRAAESSPTANDILSQQQQSAGEKDDVEFSDNLPYAAFGWNSSDSQSKPAPQRPTQPPPVVTTPERSQPRAVETSPGSSQTHYVIKIFVESDRLTIGGFETVETKGWTTDERLALTLEAISETMTDIWTNVRRDVSPAVRFLVAPGAEGIQQQLTKTLASMNIPTRGVFPSGPDQTAEKFFGDTDVQSTSQTPAAAPAAPAEPTPARPRTGRRNSI